MNRRNFFKSLGVSAVALSVAPSLAFDSVSEEISYDVERRLLFTEALEAAHARIREDLERLILYGVDYSNLKPIV